MFDGSTYTGGEFLCGDSFSWAKLLSVVVLVLDDHVDTQWLFPHSCGFCVLAGAWLDDRFEGWGRVSYADSSEYEGDLQRGERHGQVKKKKKICGCLSMSSSVLVCCFSRWSTVFFSLFS